MNFQNTSKSALLNQKGNAVIIALVALVIVAVGALGYLSTRTNEEATSAPVDASASSEPAAGENKAEVAEAKPDAEQAPQIEIKPGNPTVAMVKGKEIKRAEVVQYMQTLPQNIQQLPIEQLFPLALDQVINSKIIDARVDGVSLDNDPVVKAQMAEAKKNIVRTVYMQQEAQKALTEDRLQAAYDEYVKNFPEVEEIKSRHILVKDEDLAKDLIKQLKDGGDFDALAKEYSVDSTKATGGQLNYIAKGDQVLPGFIEALFDTKVGEFTKKPVETEVGYHIIEVQDIRQRPPAPYEQAKPFLAAQLRGSVLNEVIAKWRDQADVETFDINGNGIEPAGGEEAPDAETPTPETAARATTEAAPEEAANEETPAEAPAE